MTFIRVAPVRKSITVNAPQAHAFDVFARRLDAWWPRAHHIAKPAMKEAVIEPRAGGRWYEKGEDDSECDWGRVLAWEPPSRLVLSWTVNGKFQIDETVESEVEVRFIAEGEKTTRVELEHRIAAEDAQALRDAVDSPGGWTGLLELYAKEAEAK
ncbi:MAG TPA: SRPBCC family protein [Rhizomicrobium sp.]|nr:SRPBCC family protein [Rhizomicrobium sp.]